MFKGSYVCALKHTNQQQEAQAQADGFVQPCKTDQSQ